jgi:hypothetical protein
MRYAYCFPNEAICGLGTERTALKDKRALEAEFLDYEKGIQCNWVVSLEHDDLDDGSKLHIEVESSEGVYVYFANAFNRSYADDDDFTIAEAGETYEFHDFKYPTYVMIRPRSDADDFGGAVKLNYWATEVPLPAWSGFEKNFWIVFYTLIGTAVLGAAISTAGWLYHRRTGKLEGVKRWLKCRPCRDKCFKKPLAPEPEPVLADVDDLPEKDHEARPLHDFRQMKVMGGREADDHYTEAMHGF